MDHLLYKCSHNSLSPSFLPQSYLPFISYSSDTNLLNAVSGAHIQSLDALNAQVFDAFVVIYYLSPSSQLEIYKLK